MIRVFKTQMLYHDERGKCDLEVFHRHLQSEIQECLKNEIQEKSATEWYTAMEISLECMTGNQEIQCYF